MRKIKTKILIADDEADIVSMLRSFFESKGYLESFHGLYNAFDIKLVCSRPYRRRGLAVVGDKPTAVEGLADIALVGESEREVEAGRHGAVVLRLTEDIAYIGAEKRQRERAGVAVAHRH